MQQDRPTLASDACQRQASPRRVRLLASLRRAARFCILGLLLLAALLTLLILLLQRHQQDIADGLLSAVAEATGIQVTASSVDVILLPVPTVTLSHVRVTAKNCTADVAYASLRPDFAALLTGTLAPAHVELLRPQITGDLPLHSLLAAPSSATTGDDDVLPDLPHLPWACTLDIRQGQADLRAGDGSRLMLTNLDCALRLSRDGSLKGQLGWNSLTLSDAKSPLLSARSVRLQGKSHLRHPLQASDLTLNGVLSCGRWLQDMKGELHWQRQKGQHSLQARLGGKLIQNGQAIPLSLAGRMSWPGGEKPVTFHEMQLALDQDSGTFTGTLLPATDNGPCLEGELRLRHLSLTRWLGFARDLAPGLQWALNDLTEVAARFRMDAAGLQVPSVTAVASGSRFTGSGGVASWRQPVVALDLRAPQVELGRAIPESVGTLPEAPRYAYAPLTSFDPRPDVWDAARQRSLPEERPQRTGKAPARKPAQQAGGKGASDARSTNNLGYDIRLAADAVQYGPLPLHDALVVITPGKPASSGGGRANIDVRTTSCAGQITGRAVVGGGPATTEFDIALQARNVQAAELGSHFPDLPLRNGRLSASVDVTSLGDTIPAFLANLSGKAELRAAGGSLRPAHPLQRFDSLSLSLALRNGRWKQGRAGLDGLWNLTQTGQGYTGSLRLDGLLWLGGSSRLALDGMQSRLQLTAAPTVFALPKELQLTAQGRMSAQVSPPRLRLEQAQIQALETSYAGTLRVEADKGLSLNGTGTLRCPDLIRTVALATGRRLNLPDALRRAEISADLQLTPQALHLRDLSTTLLETSVNGDISVLWREQPHIDLQLTIPYLDTDKVRRLLDPQGVAEAERAEAARREARRRGTKIPPVRPPRQGEPWDLRFMTTFTAEGSLTVDHMASWRVRLDDLKLPFRLSEGRLDYGPMTGRFYGAALHSSGNVQFERDLRFENTIRVENFNLGAASTARGWQTGLYGLASVTASLDGRLSASGQMPQQLNGRWRFAVRNGAYQSRREDGSPKDSPTRFSLVSGSGTLLRGVARSNNLTLRSSDMDVVGGGWIDLTTETLDCTLHVNTGRLSNIPVRVHGSIHQTQTSIGAGTVLLYALSGITQGLFDIIGGLLEGTWRILR